MLASKVFKDKGERFPLQTSHLVCPVCGYEYQHIGDFHVIHGENAYKAGWGGRGSLYVLSVFGECGCQWELCFGEHKGNIECFTRVIELCRNGGDRE